jgi:hypothetical protein
VILTSALTSLLCMNGVAWIRAIIDLQTGVTGWESHFHPIQGIAKYNASKPACRRY